MSKKNTPTAVFILSPDCYELQIHFALTNLVTPTHTVDKYREYTVHLSSFFKPTLCLLGNL